MTSPVPDSRPSITCPECGRTSWHPQDVTTGYCGYCHWWTSDEVLRHCRPAPAAPPAKDPDAPTPRRAANRWLGWARW